MVERARPRHNSGYLLLVICFLLVVTISLGSLLVRQSKASIITLMQTRMLDIANTAAAMIDGDVLAHISPEDQGTDGYETIMKTLTYFQDNIDLKYIYHIRDMGDGTFSFGLDPTVDDPGEFGSPIVYTDALYKASKGTAAADEVPYHDAWGSFYSAYSPVLDSQGKVAGIIAVDFSAEWYNQQLATLTRTTIIVALLSLLVGGGIAFTIITRSEKKIGSIQGQLNEMAATLMHEIGNDSAAAEVNQNRLENNHSIDTLEKQIHSMQSELRTQLAHVHGQAHTDEMTGVKSKQAYLKMESKLDDKLKKGALSSFAIVVCDVNGLKKINDTQGHKAGDEYIRRACTMICDVFCHSPVYRVGGDEFVAILKDRDYDNRNILIHELHQLSAAHIASNDAIVSGGLAEYDPRRDHSVRDVFERADAKMYKEKTLLKSLGAVIRDDESNRSDQDDNDNPAINIRRHILIADDIEATREMLGDLLSDDYDIFYAADGVEALNMLREHKDETALALLDLSMPNMTGREVLREMQVSEELMSIPVIVLTADQDAELDSLKIGAMDFISKPFPNIDIVKARIAKCIELSENRDLIRHTERDKLTGLYHFDFFLRYVKRLDQQSKGIAYDAFVCNVNQFHALNEQYGSQFGDLVLRSIGIEIKKLARKTGGIGCRQRGDTFLLYCPHRDDYEQLIEKFTSGLYFEKDAVGKVTMRFGVFSNAAQEPEIEQRFVCAGIAADNAANDPKTICGYYP